MQFTLYLSGIKDDKLTRLNIDREVDMSPRDHTRGISPIYRKNLAFLAFCCGDEHEIKPFRFEEESWLAPKGEFTL
jgi:hypothetical protein